MRNRVSTSGSAKRGHVQSFQSCTAGSTCGDGQQEWDAFSSLLQRWAADPQSLMSGKALRSDGSASLSTTRETDAGMGAVKLQAPLTPCL